MSDIKFFPRKQDAKWPVGLQSVAELFKPVLIFFIALLALYFMNRILFFGWNYNQFRSYTGLEILQSFVHGIRFDLTIIGPIIFLYLLIVAIPYRWLRMVLVIALTSFHLGLLFVNYIDTELVNFMGRRFTKASLYLAGEGQMGSLAQYSFLAAITVLALTVVAVLTIVFLKKIRRKFEIVSWKVKLITILIIFPLALIFSRGGLQYKPITFVDAKVLPYPYAHHLILNTGFTFVKSFGKSTFQKEKYFTTDEMLRYLNLSGAYKNNIAANGENYNLVIFIVESLSKEYISEKRTPFLSELIKNGVYFDKAYANGRRSIEGIASILAGVPALMEEPFLNSEFATNDFVGLGQLLKNKKYQTSFFHGATNGSMRFDVFTKASGFDDYYGKNEFPDQSKQDGFWGIYDDSFFKFACDKMTNFNQPFGSVMFTLSSHQPYKVPAEFEQIYAAKYQQTGDEKTPILKTISYFDYSLENYFACAKSQNWFEKTIFVILADHTGPAMGETQNSFKQKFEIPIIFYSENKEILTGLNTDQYAQQIDLLPTLNDLLKLNLLSKNHLARSLYQAGPKAIALMSDQQFELVGDPENINDNHLKAIKQYYSQGLYDNRLYFPQGKGN